MDRIVSRRSLLRANHQTTIVRSRRSEEFANSPSIFTVASSMKLLTTFERHANCTEREIAERMQCKKKKDREGKIKHIKFSKWSTCFNAPASQREVGKRTAEKNDKKTKTTTRAEFNWADRRLIERFECSRCTIGKHTEIASRQLFSL